MANSNTPNGFTPAYHQSGGTIRSKEGRVLEASATIFSGDLVKIDGAGNVIPAAAGDACVGAFAGCEYIAGDGSIEFKQSWVNGTPIQADSAIKAYYYDDANIIYTAQFAGASGRAVMGGLFLIDVAAGGTAANGRSLDEIGAADAGGPLRLLDFVEMDDNDSEQDNASAYVMIAEHQYAVSVISAAI